MLEHVERTDQRGSNGRGVDMETQAEDYANTRTITYSKKRSPFLLPVEAARYLRLCTKSLERHRIAKTGPTYRKHGGKIVYHEDELDEWTELQIELTQLKRRKK